MVYLRIIFTILSAIGIALAIPGGILFGWEGIGYCVFGAILFFVLMLFCRQSQELKEFREKTQNSTTQDSTSSTQENN